MDGSGSVVPEEQTFGTTPVTMPFDRISDFKKDKTSFIPRYFSRQLTAFDLTLDLLQKKG